MISWLPLKHEENIAVEHDIDDEDGLVLRYVYTFTIQFIYVWYLKLGGNLED